MHYEDDIQLSPSVALPKAILPTLEVFGFQVTDHGPHLRVELSYESHNYGVAFVLDAENYFVEGKSDRELRTIRSRLVTHLLSTSDDADVNPRKDCFIYLVATAEFIRDPKNALQILEMENDTRFAMKFVVTKEVLPSRLGRFFDSDGVAARKSGIPKVLINGEMPAASTRTLSNAKTHYDLEKLTSAAHFEFSQDVIRIFGFIMGSEFQLQFFSDGIRIARGDAGPGFPESMVSNGERVAVSLAYFIASEYHEESPDDYIAIVNTIQSLDEMKVFRVFEVLREFVMATGRSLYLNMPRSHLAQYAKRKFTAIGVDCDIQR